MAYTAVKLADVQKAINVVKTAQINYDNAVKNSKKDSTFGTAATNALTKLEKAQKDFEKETFVTPAIKAQAAARDKAYNYMISEGWRNTGDVKRWYDIMMNPNTSPAAAKTAEINWGKAVEKASKDAETNFNNLDKAYNTSYGKAKNDAWYKIDGVDAKGNPNKQSLQYIYNTAQDKWQQQIDSVQPFLDARNDALGGVTGYIDTIRGSLGDVTKLADAKQVQTLLNQIQTSVKNTKLDDLIKPITSMISQIDPLKMSAIPTVNIQGANPDVFSNIDPNTKLPILDQGGLDAVLDRYKSNKIDTQQYRDNWNKFGWNVKSDASTAMRGPAVVGLDMGTISAGISGGARGIVKAGTNQAASDADFKKAADQLGININDYYATKETTGAYGTKSTAKVLDKQSLYNDIADRTKDFYMVANSIDGNKHAALLFRADGSGNLVPVTNEQGAPLANYYNATRNVTGETWYGDLLPIAAIAASLAMPGLTSALAGKIGAATGLGTAGIGGAISSTLAGAVTNAGLAALTGGNIQQAALMGGAGALAQVKAADIANTALGNVENVKAVAKLAGISLDQAQQTIAQGITTGLASAAIAPNNIGENILANVAGNFTSAQAQNAVAEYMKDSGALPFMLDAAGNVAKVGSEALVRGEDLYSALQAAGPSIAASGLKAQSSDTSPKQTTAGLPVDQVMAMGDMGPDYSSITGQAGAGALSGFGSGATTPTDWKLATPLPGYATGKYGYEDIQRQAALGALGSIDGSSIVTKPVDPRTLEEVEVIGQREIDTPLWRYTPSESMPSEERDTPEFEEYVKASQEFPLTEYTPEALAGIGNIRTAATGLSGAGSLGLLSTPTLSGATPQQPTPTMLQTKMPQTAYDQLLQLQQLYPGLANVDRELLDVISSRLPDQSYYTYGAQQQQSPLDMYTQYLKQEGAQQPQSEQQVGLGPVETEKTSFIRPDEFSFDAARMAGLQRSDRAQPFMFRSGGDVHIPQFITGKTGYYVEGEGDGQSDSIPAMLADGEYVFDADTVAALGNGSNKAGARMLDEMRENIRKHKRSASHKKIPPAAKSPLEYLKG
jgi:YD repeat-containing protein